MNTRFFLKLVTVLPTLTVPLASISYISKEKIDLDQAFFLTFRKKLKAKKTQAEKKTQANFPKNSSKLFENSIFCHLE